MQLVVVGDCNCTLDYTMDRIGVEPHPQSSRCLNSIITQQDLEGETSTIQALHMGVGLQQQGDGSQARQDLHLQSS